MKITRCICYDMTFSKGLRFAQEQNLSLEQVMTQTGMGTKCGLCKPYLCQAMKTGQVVFDRVITSSLDDSEDSFVCDIANGH